VKERVSTGQKGPPKTLTIPHVTTIIITAKKGDSPAQ
jgi:hypothetical protein